MNKGKREDRKNRDLMLARQDRKRSNAAGSHRTDTDYRRRPKHKGRGWSED